MNAAKFSENEYIQFLIATQKAYSCTEAERVHPNQGERVAHDAINRLLHRLEPSSNQLWAEAQTLVTLKQGILVVDEVIPLFLKPLFWRRGQALKSTKIVLVG